MQQWRNNEGNFNDKNALSSIPGMATLKAISIFAFPFLRGEGLQEQRNMASVHTLEIEENTSITKQETEEASGTYVDNKLQEDIPVITKAQSMVQHLKHTKNS